LPHLPFEAGGVQERLEAVFSAQPGEEEAERLSRLVSPLAGGWWELDLGHGLTLVHGIRDGRYVIDVTGDTAAPPSVFDRVFSGPVIPATTPHPRKVRFDLGG
jgi:hypothetical protein